MKLTMQTDYALRTLLYLAQRPGRSTIADIAEFYRISAHHMGKVAHQLGKLGLIRNIRGPGGGLELARPAGSITIGAVIRAFEGTTRMLECVDSPGVCVIQPGCGLRLALAEAERRQMDYLNGISIGSLVARAEEPIMLS
jgi:Rrf2 family nitric oxide-sensitive transcriptional repressor